MFADSFQSLVQLSLAISLGSYPVCDSDMAPGGVVGPIQCEKTSAPDDVELSCGVTYNGKTAPELVWRRAGDSSNSTDTHCVTGYNRVTCNTTLTANLQLTRTVFICELPTHKYSCSLEIKNIPCKHSTVYLLFFSL